MTDKYIKATDGVHVVLITQINPEWVAALEASVRVLAKHEAMITKASFYEWNEYADLRKNVLADLKAQGVIE